MIHDGRDDMERDADLQYRLDALPRSEVIPRDFTDRVVRDLGRRGLVRAPGTRVSAQWLAAAAVIFAAGVGIGSVIASARSAPRPVSPPNAPIAAERSADINLPPTGHSEVWF